MKAGAHLDRTTQDGAGRLFRSVAIFSSRPVTGTDALFRLRTGSGARCLTVSCSTWAECKSNVSLQKSLPCLYKTSLLFYCDLPSFLRILFFQFSFGISSASHKLRMSACAPVSDREVDSVSDLPSTLTALVLRCDDVSVAG